MQRIILKNANVFDGKESLGNTDVVVEGERIKTVGSAPSSNDVTADDIVFDLAGKTLMPGMVAGHGHFSLHDIDLRQPAGPDLAHTAAYMGVVAADSARRTLHAGFTSYVGAGSIHNIDVELASLIETGIIQGPRIVPCSRDFVPTGATVDYIPEHWNVQKTINNFGAICDGPDAFRKEIRRDAKRGAQIVKLYPEGGHGLGECTRMAPDEIKVAVETANLCGVRVRCHVYSKPVIKACIEAGIKIIDHGDHLDEELIDICIENNIFVLPSMYFARATVGVYHGPDDVERWFASARDNLALGVEKGLKFVTGDDFGLVELPHGENARELALYVEELGVPANEVLKWATMNGAEMSGLPDTGRITEGHYADLVVVGGDPLADIAVLTDSARINLVMKGGSIAKSTL